MLETLLQILFGLQRKNSLTLRLQNSVYELITEVHLPFYFTLIKEKKLSDLYFLMKNSSNIISKLDLNRA